MSMSMAFARSCVGVSLIFVNNVVEVITLAVLAASEMQGCQGQGVFSVLGTGLRLSCTAT